MVKEDRQPSLDEQKVAGGVIEGPINTGRSFIYIILVTTISGL